MSSSPDDRDRADAARHFAEAQSELFEGIRSILSGGGVLGEVLASVSSFGARREELMQRAALERIREVFLAERAGLAPEDEATGRAFGTVIAVLDREIERLASGGRGARQPEERLREVPVE